LYGLGYTIAFGGGFVAMKLKQGVGHGMASSFHFF
jgi:hypothetical protein